MKVLMFGWEFPPHISGGLGTACYGITKYLSKKVTEITFVLPKKKNEYRAEFVKVVGSELVPKKAASKSTAATVFNSYQMKEMDAVLKMYEVDSTLHPYMNEETYKEYVDTISQKKRISSSEKVFKDEITGVYGLDLLDEVARYACIAEAVLRNNKFNIIHAHDWMTFPAAVNAKRITGLPLIVHIHSTEFDRSGDNGNSAIIEIEKLGMMEADHIITVSYRTRGLIEEKYGISREKITVIHNSTEDVNSNKEDVSTHRCHANNPLVKDKVVLFLGRITAQKGPEYFLKAAAEVIKERNDVRFVMAGSGDMGKKMIKEVVKLGLSERFHFTGFLNEEERSRLFSVSDLFVMPSVSEPFGITPLEALEHGVPVLVSNQSGVIEMFDDIESADFWDIEALSAKIIKLLDNPSMGIPKKKVIDSAVVKNWDEVASKIRAIYGAYA